MSLDDGRTLAWRETGEGPVLVMLHGWSISGLAFAELAERLKSRFRVLLPDLPGHGDSSACRKPSLEGLARDIEHWIDVIGGGPVCLAGWSLGGMLAMQLAHAAADRLQGLILISTTPRFTRSADWPQGLPPGQVKSMQRRLATGFEATLADFFQLTFAGERITPRRIQQIRRFAVLPAKRPDPQVVSGLLELLACQDQRWQLGPIQLPTWVIHGALDQITPVSAGQTLAARLPQARLLSLPDVAHAPFWSRPEQVAAMIEESLAWVR